MQAFSTTQLSLLQLSHDDGRDDKDWGREEEVGVGVQIVRMDLHSDTAEWVSHKRTCHRTVVVANQQYVPKNCTF